MKNHQKNTTRNALSLSVVMLAALASVAPVQALAGTPAAAASADAFAVGRVLLTGDMPPSLRESLQKSADSYTGARKTREQAAAIADALSNSLRQSGYPLGTVVLTDPAWAQLSKDGTLSLTAFLGQVGRIAIGQNRSEVSDKRLLQTVTNALCPNGQVPCVLTSTALERAALLLSDLPGVGVEPFKLSPDGVGVGQTAVMVNVRPSAERLTGIVSVDNYGLDATGATRLGASLRASNLFHEGDAFSVGAQTTDKSQSTGSLSFSMPLNHSGLSGYVAAAQTNYSLPSVNADGVVTNAQVGASYPVYRGLGGNWNIALAGFYTRSTQTVAGFSSWEPRELNGAQLTLAGNAGERIQDISQRSWGAQATLTDGKVSQSIVGTDPSGVLGSYQKLTINATGRIPLPMQDSYALLKFAGQAASKNLDPAEAMGVSGIDALKAYPSNEGTVDSGVVLSLELRKRFTLSDGSQVTPGVFMDYLNGSIVQSPYANWQTSLGYRNAALSNHRELSDWGVGVNWLSANKRLNAGLYAAWKTSWSAEPVQDSSGAQGRVLASISYQF